MIDNMVVVVRLSFQRFSLFLLNFYFILFLKKGLQRQGSHTKVSSSKQTFNPRRRKHTWALQVHKVGMVGEIKGEVAGMESR
jgi:hypothetical protein